MTARLRPELADLPAYTPGRTVPGAIKLASNETVQSPLPSVLEAIEASADTINRYPDNGHLALKEQLSEHLAADGDFGPERIAVGCGSVSLCQQLIQITCSVGDEVVFGWRSFEVYPLQVRVAGATPVQVPLRDETFDLDAMLAAVTERTRLIFVCNPNNPTGTVVNAAELKAFAIDAAKKVPVFIDEAYLDCADDYEGQTMVKLVAEGHNVVIARTFSKIYGMAGLRMGYGIMPAKLAKEVKPLSTGSVNMMGVVAASASLQDATYVAETRAKIKAGRDALIAVIKDLKKEYAEPQGNFVFFKTGMPIKDFQDKMKAEMVLVGRPFPPLTEWARISIGTPEEMAVCHAALKKVLA